MFFPKSTTYTITAYYINNYKKEIFYFHVCLRWMNLCEDLLTIRYDESGKDAKMNVIKLSQAIGILEKTGNSRNFAYFTCNR